MKNLYRKYRPLKLSGVVGQEQVTRSLESTLKQGKVGHAYLFVGPRGCGKTSVARILAHEVNGFKYELEDDYVDIIEIDGASNRGIDNIRELREKVMIAPTAGKYKIYIIDEVHMLTKEAFNALLKTLEEPPEHAIFIMATTDAYKVPITITSRAAVYTFKLADSDIMFDYLKGVCEKEQIKITDEALKVIVKRGGGSFRDSLSLLDQISTLSDTEITKEMVIAAMGLPQDEKIAELLGEYANGDVVKITTIIKDLLSSGVKAETLAEEIISTIVADPKPELLPLLAKLPEVKAPYAEARLLVALATQGLIEHSFSGRTFSSSTSYAGQPGKSARRAASSVPSGIYVSELENLQMSSKKNVQPPASNTPVSASEEIAFDWFAYLEKVQGLSEAVWSQLKKARYEFDGATLHIYPGKKIIKSILSRDNNKKILIDAAGGSVKIIIHEENEVPSNVKKDETLERLSDIMGGEVRNDGGGNPF